MAMSIKKTCFHLINMIIQDSQVGWQDSKILPKNDKTKTANIYQMHIDLKSWCLIHNAHLGKILSFCKVLDLKITLFKKISYLIFFISAMVIKGWNSKVKTIILFHRTVCISIQKISNTCIKKGKWALWMKYQEPFSHSSLTFWHKFWNFSLM